MIEYWWFVVKYIQIQVWVSTNFALILYFEQPQTFAPEQKGLAFAKQMTEGFPCLIEK